MVALNPNGPLSAMQSLKSQQFVRPNNAARFNAENLKPNRLKPEVSEQTSMLETAANGVDTATSYFNSVAGIAALGMFALMPLGLVAGKLKLNSLSNLIGKTHIPIGETAIASSSVGKSVAGAFGSATRKAANMFEHIGLKKASNYVRSAPQTIATNPAGNTLLDAALIGGGALSLFGVAHGAVQNIDGLRHMLADISGQDYNTITTNQVLFGNNVPPVVAKERKLILERTGFRVASEGINMGISIRSLMRGNLGLASMIVPMAFNMFGEALIGESVMGVYKGLKDAHAKGVEIPPDTLLAFIQLAQPELARHKVQFSQALVEEYVAEKTSPADMLLEANDGKMIARLNAIVEKHANDKPTISHVERLNGKASGQALPVLGAHTAKVAEAAASPAEMRL